MDSNTQLSAGIPFLAHTFDGFRDRREQELFGALSPSTQRRYRSALRSLGPGAADAGPALVCDFLEERAATGHVAGLPVVLAALAFAERLHGSPGLISGDPMVRAALRRLMRERPAQRQAPPIADFELRQLRDWLRPGEEEPRRGLYNRLESWEEAQLRVATDLALCALASDAGLRRTEAARARWQDLANEEDGSGRLWVAASKRSGDAILYVTGATMRDLEVLRQCQRWVDEAGSANGDDPRIFRLGAAQIGRRIARACAQAGLLGEFSGHSPRVGMAVRMARRGAPLQAIQRQGRWTSPEMPGRYTRKEEAGQAAAWLE